MFIPKINREDLIGTIELDYDCAAKMYRAVKVLKRKDGVGGELICLVDIKAEALSKSILGDVTKEIDDLLEERIACDLREINHEGEFADLPMDNEIHDIRLELGLETVL